ncbi:MAG: sensor histidine kinase [Actinomycetota bacterium]
MNEAERAGGGWLERAAKVRLTVPWWAAGPAAAAVATVLGLLLEMNATGAAGMFVLAVVGAVWVGLLRAGLLASLLSFICLNYFFTPPKSTFAVDKTEDLVALVVLLVVTVVVSSLFASVAEERTRAERREQEARAARVDSEASELRAALISAVTHDLRTPITSIKVSVGLLLDQQAKFDEAQVTELLEGIAGSVDRLNDMVGNVLDFARVKAGALEPTLQNVDLLEVLGAVLQRMQPALNGHRVSVKAVGYLPEMNLDVLQIEHIFANIIANAVRFSPPDSTIHVVLDVVPQAVRVKVTDRGPGIPPGERSRVLEPFYRMERDRPKSGSGLGLAIVSAMVAAHGGTLTLDDAPSGGLVVTTILPVRPGS